MALGAVESETEPCGGGGFHAIEEDDPALFFGDSATFAVEEVIAVEAAGDFLFVGGIGEEVTGELPDGELVEGEVIIQSFDDPVAPDPLPGISILLEAVAVGVASGIEPWECHAFAVVGAGEEAVDEFFPCVGAVVIDEVVDFGGCGRESDEVDGEAFDEGLAVGFG